jgi:hypothetical protein
MVPSASLFAIAAAADADTRLAVHRDWLARAEELAETLEVRGHDEDAVGMAGQGARFALFAHPGVLVSPRLERLFARVAARTLTQVPRTDPPSSPPRRVLHVASETYTSGGHTRVLWRWIDRDRGRVHDVVLTQQCTELMPGLRKAIKRTKGSLIELPAAAPLLERAQRLRELVAKADAVVLHTHSFDPIATLALAGMEDRPPTLFNDHASNVFWFGRSVSDLVIGGPAELPEITARRGVPADRYAGVPFPVGGTDGHGRDPSRPLAGLARSTARRRVLKRLGWPADTVLLLTAGDDYKFRGPAGASLIELVEPLLGRHPDVRLVAAGPASAGAWTQAEARTGGRVRALGRVAGLDTFYAAADVYLDSFPFGGNGAAAEAASHGLPVLGCAVTPLEGRLCRATPIFGAEQAPDVEAYRLRLDELIRQPAARSQAGERAREIVAGIDASWPERIEAAYAQAAALGPVGPLADPGDAPELVDRLVDLQNVATGHTVGSEHVVPMLRLLDLAVRDNAVRGLYGRLCGPAWRPELRRQAPSVFASPPTEPAVLRALVADFATLVAARAVSGGLVIGMQPEAAAAAVPVLEAALASHPELAVDLIIDHEPRTVRPPGALELAA